MEIDKNYIRALKKEVYKSSPISYLIKEVINNPKRTNIVLMFYSQREVSKNKKYFQKLGFRVSDPSKKTLKSYGRLGGSKNTIQYSIKVSL